MRVSGVLVPGEKIVIFPPLASSYENRIYRISPECGHAHPLSLQALYTTQ